MIAVLGLGSIGLRHARNLLELGEAVVGFDPSEERRSLLAADGAAVVDRRDDALASAGAVVIASPSGRHRDDLAAALDAGCHVLVEKPLAHTTDGMAELLARAEANGKVVAAAFNLRHHPAVVVAKAWVEDGRLGRLLWGRFLMADYLPHWRPGTDFRQGYANDPKSGGVMFDIVHEFDLAAHLLGLPTVQAAIATHTGTLGLQSEDMADMVLAHPGGAVSSVHVDFVTRPRRRVTYVAGTEACLQLDLDRRHVGLVDADGTVVESKDFPGSYADDYRDEMRSFLAAARGHGTPACPGREALAVLDALISARRLAGLPE